MGVAGPPNVCTGRPPKLGCCGGGAGWPPPSNGTSKLAVQARQVSRLPAVPSFSVPQFGQKTFMSSSRAASERAA
ncbi:MAG: hypothetical protein JNJ54_02645 [Myxococcaceae bacterium]|nr:hypothetical protein [Myxococcaceae bacterium]